MPRNDDLTKADLERKTREEALCAMREVNRLRGTLGLAHIEWTEEPGPGAGPVPGIPEWGMLTCLEASEIQAYLRRGQSVTRCSTDRKKGICLTKRWSPESVRAEWKTETYFGLTLGDKLWLEVINL